MGMGMGMQGAEKLGVGERGRGGCEPCSGGCLTG